MFTGIDRLISENFAMVKNKNIALLTNIAATDCKLRPTIYHFIDCKKINLKFIFAPEHGLFSALQDQIYVKNHKQERIPVLSLYSKKLVPQFNILKEIDALVVDLIDIGTRYYTFTWSALLLLKELARLKKKMVILDRPNPLNGLAVQGPVLEEKFLSFVGLYSIPVRHGLTIGEICNMINIEENIGADLEIIKIEGWKRKFYFPDCSLKWTVPSPNMPS
ncbi:MAG: exo-beta-N-acetylmuramidase NamZ domain-containing protein, partial [candidate division WOR-3 bacterium]